MRKIVILIAVLFLMNSISANAQRRNGAQEPVVSNKPFMYPKEVKKEKYNIAVLTPMYLDSTEWQKDLVHLPKFMISGIDFYEGVQIAADTLRQQGFKLDIFVHDSKSSTLNVQSLLESGKLDTMDLIIGNASVTDLKLLGDFAKQKQINFISAVSPSDADQTNNPYFTILQPRLQSHIEKMHRHLNTHFPYDNVVYLYRGNNNAELNGLNYFKNDILNALPSRFFEIETKNDIIDMPNLIKRLDSTNNTTIILGVLDPAMAYKYLKQIAPFAERYNIKVFCMPTAESIKALEKQDEFPGMPIFYTSSYFIDKVTPASQYITKKYKARMGGIPSDVVYKGFESLNFFSNLLIRYGVPFNSHISDNSYTFITPYKIMPVKEKGQLKYYENKFLYLMRFENGIMSYE